LAHTGSGQDVVEKLAPALNGVLQVNLSYDAAHSTLTAPVNGKQLTTYNISLGGSSYTFYPFDISVDPGASVTLSNFSIAPSV
jgi:hypothetical protein